MKRYNLPISHVKTVFASVIFIMMASGAYAQITLDWDVLTEEVSPSPSGAGQNSKISLKEPASKAKKNVRSVSKKAKQTSKPAVQKTDEVSHGKYRIRESSLKDEHDKLKPHAAPVPKVKIIAADNAPLSESVPLSEKNDIESQEPKLSKHFLEQQLNSERPATNESENPVSQQKLLPLPSLKTSERTDTARATVSVTETKALEKAEEKKSLLLNFSVFPVSEKLSLPERSVVLSKEIPQESATIKALTAKRTLLQILIFEKKSVDLTEEMQNVLDNIASVMKKEKDQRLILYSYCAADSAESGKERQCALRRALAIRSYLITQGIHSLRVELRSQGQKGAGDKIPNRTDIVVQDK